MTGASTDMLKAFGGHATSKEVERYTREAERRPQTSHASFSMNILAGSRVLSAVGTRPPHDGVR